MSDLHLTKGGCPIWETNTMEHFNKSIEIIRGMHNIDAIVVTGDISDDGSEWTYQYADRLFSSLGIPTYCCPGNHDSLKVMLEVLPESCIIRGWNMIMLNSVITDDEVANQNKSRGFLTKSSINHMIQKLEEGHPTIIALHHPPLEPGGWLNRKLLDNRSDFNEIISQYSNVRLVIYGHIHYYTDVKRGHIRYSSSSAVGFAFDKELPKFQIAKGLEGFSIIDIDKEGVMNMIGIYMFENTQNHKKYIG